MQLSSLELLAPAKDLEVGTAAIECGADAVYIAGPRFGARVAAGNPVEDIARLCDHARKFGVRIYATLNTLLREDELQSAERLVWQYYEAGVDALIVQDLGLLRLDLPPIELHASPQAVVRTPERARALEQAGFRRIILERQMSLDQIRAIREAVSCEIEFFVHGALCMSYSGQCFLSEELTLRSANRGCCAQPCRSRYDVYDANGRMLARDKHILSMKDLRLDAHIAQLARAGVTSFKIEGRLKNSSYVKNVVRHYRSVIDRFIESSDGRFARSSYGECVGGFTPNPDATFNRGYTSCFIGGKRSKWNSGDAAKALGEYLGEVRSVDNVRRTVTIDTRARIANGDGLSFVLPRGDVVGMRVEVAMGDTFRVKDTSSLEPGMKCWRNLNAAFEKELENNMPRRLVDVPLDYETSGGHTKYTAFYPDGSKKVMECDETAPEALNPARARDILRSQLSKTTGCYRFALRGVSADKVYSYAASYLNSIRRSLASATSSPAARSQPGRGSVAERALCEYRDREGDVLMRSKYCVRYELGLCPHPAEESGKEGENGEVHDAPPLCIANGGRKFHLRFDCKNCEMSVTL